VIRLFAIFLLTLRTFAAPPPMNDATLIAQKTKDGISFEFSSEGMDRPGHALYFAGWTSRLGGCAVVPFQQGAEGSTVFLPYRVHRIYAVRIGEDGQPVLWRRQWDGSQWSGILPVKGEFTAHVEPGKIRLEVRTRELNEALLKEEGTLHQMPGLRRVEERSADVFQDWWLHAPGRLVWAKDLNQNHGWGVTIPFDSPLALPEYGDVAVSTLIGKPLRGGDDGDGIPERMRRAPRHLRPRIYQLLPRLFTNTNETRKPNGTLAENGVGKFADLDAKALAAIHDELGATHVWLTGVLAQATGTDYSAIGKPADDPDLLKGLAGSPYAIKDYGDVCPDYAVDPKRRMEEFKALVERAHAAGLRVMIDFVPNHVARSHESRLISFGHTDDPKIFFSPKNNFFWLQPDSPGGGAPLRLPTVRDGQILSPTCRVLGQGDGLFGPETKTGRVTGNNASTWSPSQNDWYETVKLNYGYDFTTGKREYPHAGAPKLQVPDTWTKMDAVLAHWQSLGVDGFRCDMSHMVPPEFWAWAINRARLRSPAVYFIGEAYNNDPMKVEGGYELLAHHHNVMMELLNAGFDAVYDDPAYKTLKAIYDGPAWANDLDKTLAAQGPYVFPRSLRYAENHDEVRLASKGNWGGLGMEVGRPVSGVLFGISSGPVLLYSGQEVGEPASGSEGFSDDNGRTTIFDYWSMPEVAKWVNGHRFDGGRLSPRQKELRAFYGRLLKTCGEPAFADGIFYSLNGANKDNAAYGRLGEHASGHWLYAYVRADAMGQSRYLVVANFHRSETLRDVRVQLSAEARAALGSGPLRLVDKVGGLPDAPVSAGDLEGAGILIPAIPPLSASYFEIQAAATIQLKPL